MVLSQRLNSLAHGHIHELMGGSWAHAYADDHHREQSLAIITFAHSIQVRTDRQPTASHTGRSLVG